MLLARLATIPEVQGSKLAVDILLLSQIFLAHMHVGAPKARSYGTCPQPGCEAGTHSKLKSYLDTK